MSPISPQLITSAGALDHTSFTFHQSKMNFIKSLSPSFKVWRLLGLSPFALETISTANISRKQKLIHAFGIVAFVILSISASMMHVTYGLNRTDKWLQVWSAIGAFLFFFFANITLIESFIKRDSQLNWLIHLRSIDSALIADIGIQIDYGNEHLRHRRRLIQWKIFYSFTAIILLLPIFVKQSVHLWCSTALLALGYIIIGFRFHQFITYVDLIKYRYGLLNEFINKIHLNDLIQLSRQDGMVGVAQLVRTMSFNGVDEILPPIDKVELVYKLRHVSNLLVEANRQLNDLFCVSLSTSMIAHFYDLACSNYFIFILCHWQMHVKTPVKRSEISFAVVSSNDFFLIIYPHFAIRHANSKDASAN